MLKREKTVLYFQKLFCDSNLQQRSGFYGVARKAGWFVHVIEYGTQVVEGAFRRRRVPRPRDERRAVLRGRALVQRPPQTDRSVSWLSRKPVAAERVRVALFWVMNAGIFSDPYGVKRGNREYTFGLLGRDTSLKPSEMGYATAAEALEARDLQWVDEARRPEDPRTSLRHATRPRGGDVGAMGRPLADRQGRGRHRPPPRTLDRPLAHEEGGPSAGGAWRQSRETGIMEEIALDNMVCIPTRNESLWDAFLYEKARFEPNVDLILNYLLSAVRLPLHSRMVLPVTRRNMAARRLGRV